MADFFTRVRAFAKQLEDVGLAAWALRLTDAISSGSTGGEILMAIRWNLQELLRAQSLPTGLVEQAEKFIQEIGATGV
ncbi:MAG TPA: hypothetical protein VNU95_15345 [Candidatus Acidoferrales bacterium]|jgi:hypothetical protein|nr:hypothetical protein [Candidatus Acidoferrales bacterium]